ncbi:MAG: hypothetical protein HKN30_15430 [Sulfitobacter sp.]|nr:hypothetical protein [Sulfitobacter sp.]
MGLAPIPISLTQQPLAGLPNDPAIASAATLPSSETSTVLSSDFETFLKMLTAQAQYQDPLEPIDSSEYAAQLAQFSMVEQQVLTNDRIAEMTAQLQVSNMSRVAGFIGMAARTSDPVYFGGQGIPVATDPATGADRAFLLVKDGQGNTVDRLEFPLSASEVIWDGQATGGGTYPAGRYSFEVESLSKGEVIATNPAPTYAQITEARDINGEAGLILEGGITVLARNLEGLRDRI